MSLYFYRLDPVTQISANFEYSEGWSGTIIDTNYPATFTGFNTPSNETPLESFENSGGWSGT
jgi:hypothetical protein